MTERTKPVAATMSAFVVILAFSGPVIGGDNRGSELPRSARVGRIHRVGRNPTYFAKSMRRR